jgi:hypothetical protein
VPLCCSYHGCAQGPDQALARADAGRQIDELLDEIAELQQEITLSPTETLQDAAVKLRRLSVNLEGEAPVRPLAGHWRPWRGWLRVSRRLSSSSCGSRLCPPEAEVLRLGTGGLRLAISRLSSLRNGARNLAHRDAGGGSRPQHQERSLWVS